MRVGDDQVICLLDIWQHEEADYEKFVRDPRRVGRDRLDPLLDQDALQCWLNENKKTQVAQQRQIGALEPLPNAIRPWLDPPGWGMDSGARDLVIYESEKWVEGFRRPEIADYWQTYHDIVSNIIDGTENAQELTDWPEVKLACKDDRYVLFSNIETIETDDSPARQLLFLLAPFKREPSKAEIAKVVTTAHPIYALHENTTVSSPRPLKFDEVVPFASRAYPWYLLADKDSWLEIEREKEANLALSPEEEQVLRSVSMTASDASALPIFINGRAGSGQSTMLFYLFADYCHRKYYYHHGLPERPQLPGNPLFLNLQRGVVKGRQGFGA